ncbi:sugar ABC transporter ATP-binding protein [Phyllobacterium sp. 21LDTY02-6]|uniref:sugar ABC transporter ATP-binding protein n=1 Tax=unclassified Phyllobacterium TaxID=2638441 RepID=UPI002020E571|nr:MULTISPECIES: sugar ABC transporter ATP-binding protein [unclassified Phyllobacterium]MCO4319416.1 sugar ABC transporter ATP-binding protein [Phyllobacterium sp. 21LDTY02-6]MCX8279822.1 sugar ABC transporter ATP-binding protein [Phyllobacterium sp. 0TCS1.6C]MCX8295574.1 sugar ABC transporter ATP-binding protein [Phyllobacterium sp. 0TCS1.6A]
MPDNVLTVRNVSKIFLPSIVALESASLEVRPGEVHCLLGANGAGKSTLLKIIAGAFRPTGGELAIGGQPVELRSPADAARHGISMIYQELDLVPQLTVEQNLFLGHAPTRMGIIDHAERRRRANEALARVGARFRPDARVETLSVANQQLTAIARSLTMDAKVIIMDEPSASLNETELKSVFEVIRELVRQGVAIVYVSHRLGELREIGDRVTVLRGGRTIGTYSIEETSDTALVEAIIGKQRSLIERKPRKPVTGDTALRVNRLRGAEGLDIAGLEVRWGEVVGLTGLNGSGRTSFLKALFGAHHFDGEILLEDRPFHPRHPADAIRRGVGLVPENRKTEGLVLHAPIYKNATLPSMRSSWLTRHKLQKERTVPVLKSLSTKYGKPEQAVVQLSGGNQQKVVLAKWIINGARILLLDEPSRGLDIGAKADLYDLVDKLAEDGAAVIVASSELEELYAACDNIWVFHEGRNIGRYDPANTDRDAILRATILGEQHV